MKHTTKLLVMLAAVAGTVGLAAAGWAYWTSGGTGTTSAPVGTLNAPTGVGVTSAPGSGSVQVAWTASDATPPAVAPDGYFVQRDGTDACGSLAAPLASTSTSCDDTGVATGDYEYTVTAVFATGSWTAASDPDPVTVEKADTTTVVVSTTGSPSVVGQQVTYTATVSVDAPGSGTPTGNMEFFDDGTPISSCGGTSGNPLSGTSATCAMTYSASGSHTITAQYLGGSNHNPSPTSSSITQIVNPASTSTSLTVTGSPVIYGDEETVTFTSVVTAPGSPTGSVAIKQGTTTLCTITLPGTTCAPTSGTTLNASGTAYAITAVYSGDTNFNSSTSDPQDLTVSKAPLTITASNGSMTYGGTVPTITASYAGFVNSETSAVLTTQPTCSTTATSTSPVAGSPYTSSCSGAAAANYTISYTPESVTVSRAPLTITASNGSMTYGGTVPTITASYAGFVSGETSAVLTTQPTCSTTATSTSPVAGSPYTSSCSGAAAANYTISYTPGSVTVTKASQTITFTSTAPPGATVGGTAYTPAATATSGLSVVFTSATSSVCTVSGSTVSFVAAGTCTINANQAGDTNYNVAPQVQQSFTVAKGSQTISFTSTVPTTATVGGATYTVSATATSGLTVGFSSGTPTVCTVSGSTVTFIAAGTCTINANQAGNSNYNAAPQVQQSLTVTASELAITSVARSGGNKKVIFTGTGGVTGKTITVTICAVNSFPCTAINTAGTSTTPVLTANGDWASAQSSNNLAASQTYFAQAVQTTTPAGTSAVFTFSTATL